MLDVSDDEDVSEETEVPEPPPDDPLSESILYPLIPQLVLKNVIGQATAEFMLRAYGDLNPILPHKKGGDDFSRYDLYNDPRKRKVAVEAYIAFFQENENYRPGNPMFEGLDERKRRMATGMWSEMELLAGGSQRS